MMKKNLRSIMVAQVHDELIFDCPPEEIDLMLVPGVAFDPAGRRLGRGRGFYDRYLSRPDATHIYKVGLCRPGALVPEVPAEAHDVVMDRVATF